MPIMKFLGQSFQMLEHTQDRYRHIWNTDRRNWMHYHTAFVGGTRLIEALVMKCCRQKYWQKLILIITAEQSSTLLSHFVSFLVHAKHEVATAKVRPHVGLTFSGLCDLLIFLFRYTTSCMQHYKRLFKT